MAKHEILVRINVLNPPAGVTMCVQEGRYDLLSPSRIGRKKISFEVPLNVDVSSDRPNFLGKFAQGPKHARFLYVNSGTYAGQTGSCWGRRAKISLMNITNEQVSELLLSPDSMLEISFQGTGRDGGPVCGSIPKGIADWTIIKV